MAPLNCSRAIDRSSRLTLITRWTVSPSFPSIHKSEGPFHVDLFPLAMQAGGNDALALLLTVTSHLLGVFTVPFFVKALAAADGASFDAIQLLIKLVRVSRCAVACLSWSVPCSACHRSQSLLVRKQQTDYVYRSFHRISRAELSPIVLSTFSSAQTGPDDVCRGSFRR